MGTDFKKMAERLIIMRDDIKRVDASSTGARKAVELDQSRVGRLSRMDALQDQAMANAISRRRRMELNRIEAALGRIEDGEFGYCILCGEAIEMQRLERDPATPHCSGCITRQK